MNSFWERYNLINTVEINHANKIQIASVKKGNIIGIDIRKFYKKDNVWNHGKGLTVSHSNWEEFKDIINKIK